MVEILNQPVYIAGMIKNPKRPRDVNQLAKMMVDQVVAEPILKATLSRKDRQVSSGERKYSQYPKKNIPKSSK